MEDSWFLSTPVSLNANTTALEMKETKTQRIIYSHWWNGKYPGVPWVNIRATKTRQLQQNQPTGNLLDGNSQWVWTLYSTSNPSIYWKRINRSAKKRDWNTKRRKQQQTKTLYEWDRNINKTSDGNIKRRRTQTNIWTETRQTGKHPSQQNIETRNWFAPLQNTQDEKW